MSMRLKSLKNVFVSNRIDHRSLVARAPAEPRLPPGAGIDTWYQNGMNGRYVVAVVEGRLPVSGAQTQQATVRTDTDCAPIPGGSIIATTRFRLPMAAALPSSITINDASSLPAARRIRASNPFEQGLGDHTG